MHTIWLASYLKSGNTWFRMLLSNLSAEDGVSVDINDLPERAGIASARGPFDYLTLIDSGLLTADEIDCLRPRVYEQLASGEQDDEYDSLETVERVRFVKCHDAYTLTCKGEPLLAGRSGADGAIVIVRDPRDVASSLANHNHSTVDSAIAMMGDVASALCARPAKQHNQLRQQLLGWSGHVASWLDQTDIPVHLVRYEDMQADTAGVLARALAFAGRAATAEQIRQAVALASFAQLQSQERERGFREAPPHLISRGQAFFRRGEAGAWRDELTAEQVARIEEAHAAMMRRLGYEPVKDKEAAPRERAPEAKDDERQHA